jgi:phage-related protein
VVPSELKRVHAVFYAMDSGKEPVREWLMELSRDDRRELGRQLMKLEFGWPVGMPLSRAMGRGLHELRVTLDGRRHARVFFYIDLQENLVLLHAIIKRTRTTPFQELAIARRRHADHRRSDHE